MVDTVKIKVTKAVDHDIEHFGLFLLNPSGFHRLWLVSMGNKNAGKWMLQKL